jgi:hypothetical protein
MVWEKGAVPHEVYARQEHPGMVVSDRYDMNKNKWLSDIEVLQKHADELNKMQEEKRNRPPFEVPSRLLDDWTGSKWANHPYTYGVEPFPPKSEPQVPYQPPKEEEPEEKPKEAVVLWIASDARKNPHHMLSAHSIKSAKKPHGHKKHHGKKHHGHKKHHAKTQLMQEEDSLIQLDSNVNEELDADVELDTEATVDVEVDAEETNPDPFDSNLADVDKIMKRYENQDIKKELATKKMSLGKDPKGGIDSIA